MLIYLDSCVTAFMGHVLLALCYHPFNKDASPAKTSLIFYFMFCFNVQFFSPIHEQQTHQ